MYRILVELHDLGDKYHDLGDKLLRMSKKSSTFAP